jgi:hypothetical protein
MKTNQEIQATYLQNIVSPHRIISLGFYDGTTNGLILFEKAGLVFKYDLISWDGAENWRVFCLAPLRPDDFVEVTNILSSLGEPKWPCWHPVWRFSSDSQQHDVEQSLNVLLNSSGPYVSAVLSNDLCTSIRTAIVIGDELKNMVDEFVRTGERQPFESWVTKF